VIGDNTDFYDGGPHGFCKREASEHNKKTIRQNLTLILERFAKILGTPLSHILCHLSFFLERANINTMLEGLLKQAGLSEIRIHDLHHPAATILLKVNVNPKHVQVLLGHSSIVIKMDRYSHVLPDMQRGMMDQLDDFFGPS
jgi:integrase